MLIYTRKGIETEAIEMPEDLKRRLQEIQPLRKHCLEINRAGKIPSVVKRVDAILHQLQLKQLIWLKLGKLHKHHQLFDMQLRMQNKR